MKVFLFVIATLFAFGSTAAAQKSDSIKPPPDSAAAEEVQKWLASSITKYGSYKTRTTSVAISDVRFEGCTIRYTQTQKSGSVSTATMGVTRTINTVKDDIEIDAAIMSKDHIKLLDHIYPELRTIEINLKNSQTTGVGDSRIIELVVKAEAADAIRTALIQSARICALKN
ncbi:MAG: hypothetical protein DMF63_01980 [Acidobacteria bacterium]|nr:MAG: hypothetical protein DMF63_01980 [Acidobacteriota bacterium]